MIIDFEDLDRVLRTFTGQDFASAVALARRLAGIERASISRTNSTVPTRELRTVYARRARNPRFRKSLAQQFGQLARIAELFPDERWYIHILTIEDQARVMIFANEEGVGRVCIDETST